MVSGRGGDGLCYLSSCLSGTAGRGMACPLWAHGYGPSGGLSAGSDSASDSSMSGLMLS